jgi:hypothetical protein
MLNDTTVAIAIATGSCQLVTMSLPKVARTGTCKFEASCQTTGCGSYQAVAISLSKSLAVEPCQDSCRPVVWQSVC